MEVSIVIAWWSDGFIKIGSWKHHDIFLLPLHSPPKSHQNSREQQTEILLGVKRWRQKTVWISRNKALAKKENNGFGVGILKALNLALMTKWWWRFKTKTDSLWKRVI